MSETTAEAVAKAGARADQRIACTASASTVTALVTPMTWAIAELGHHGRVHALLDALIGRDRNAEELDAVAELLGGIEVVRGDRGNALHVDRIRVDLGAEREARQDGELLGRRCRALHVEGRIGFGVAEALRILEAIGE